MTQDGKQQLERLRGFLAQDPGNLALRGDLFDLALSLGDFAEAEAQVAHALEARPRDGGWRHRESHLLLAQGRWSEAQELLADLIAGGEGGPGTRYNLAYALFGAGGFEEAKATLAPLLEDPGAVGGSAWALLLRCEHRLRRLDEGLQAFEETRARRPLPPEAWGAASLMAIDAERLADAAAWSAEALKADPRQLEALVAAGTVALGRQDVNAALDRFDRALAIHGTDGRSWSGMAFSRMLQMDFPTALAAFRKAVAYMPDHIGTWIGLGWCEFLAGHTEASKASFEQALSLDRNFGESHGALAVPLAKLGQREEAQREIEIALKLDIRSLSARYAQAILDGEADNPEAFLRMARRVLAQQPAPDDSGRTLADVILGQRR